MLGQVGIAGQQKLLSSKVLIVGAGGLGSPAALYLAAAGVGMIGIVDADKVDLTNLQRQIIHNTSDLGVEKVKSAQTKMRAINPDVTVKAYHQLAKAGSIPKIIREYDFVIDATDNFASKFLINDACFFEKKPFSHAGVLRFDGQLMTVLPGKTACYRCIFHSLPRCRCGTLLFPRWDSWCPAWRYWHAAGNRGNQISAGHRRAVDQHVADL